MRTLLVLLALAFLSGCNETSKPADDQLTNTETAKETSPAQTEQLLAVPPSGFVRVFQLNDKKSRLSDFVPVGETDISWTQKVSFESFINDIGADPINMLDDEVRRDKQRCDFVQHFNIFSGYENGYPTSVRLFHCGNNQFVGRGEVKMIKTIQGEETFYLIRVLTRIAPFAMNKPGFTSDQVAEWTDYLRRINLCDDSIPEKSCTNVPQ